MTWKNIVLLVFGVGLVAFTIVDAIATAQPDNESFSHQLIKSAYRRAPWAFLTLPFILGVLTGHLLWGQTLP